MHPRVWVFLGCVWAALGVGLGAMGAHALEQRLDPAQLAVWETGVRYHLFQALGLIAFGLYRERNHAKDLAAGLLFLGSLLFSGSLYALSFGWMKGVMGPVTPLGGFLMIAGWLLFARETMRVSRGL
jgi:uncharacterized membrane protein YgdD (TMEM256/DUF423 family)